MFSIFRVTPAQRDRAKNSRTGKRSSSRKTQTQALPHIKPKTAAHPTATRLPVQQFPHMEKFLRVEKFHTRQKCLRVLRFLAYHTCDVFRRLFFQRCFHRFRWLFVLNTVFTWRGDFTARCDFLLSCSRRFVMRFSDMDCIVLRRNCCARVDDKTRRTTTTTKTTDSDSDNDDENKNHNSCRSTRAEM